MHKLAYGFLAITLFCTGMQNDMDPWLIPLSQLVHLNAVPFPTPTLNHAVSNNSIISLARSYSVEITREYVTIADGYECTYSARMLPCNTPVNSPIAQTCYIELIAKHDLQDKTPEQILASCNLSGKFGK